VSLQADDAAGRLSQVAALQIFRLVQEALTNVRKHSGAAKATVSLVANGPDQLRVIVADDGQGFSLGSATSGKPHALGLTSMRERVAALWGSLEVDSQPGLGTRVTATIPIPKAGKEKGRAAVTAFAG
jgi:signal transduction histidine kinase